MQNESDYVEESGFVFGPQRKWSNRRKVFLASHTDLNAGFFKNNVTLVISFQQCRPASVNIMAVVRIKFTVNIKLTDLSTQQHFCC